MKTFFTRPRVLALFAIAAVAAAVGAAQIGWHAHVFARRLTFPLDLEWMEGGTLVHALRLAQGKPIYVEPSLEFIPFLYTPLYPALLALLSKVAPLGYALGRAVSVVSFTSALVLVGVLAAREGACVARNGAQAVRAPAVGLGLAAGLVCAGAVAAGYAFTGAFYDLVRADSLLLALEAGALACVFVGRGAPSAAAAGVLIALAFFTKQTASVIGVAIGVGAMIASWRRGLVFGAVAALVLIVGVAVLTKTSHGWFWKYIFQLHQSHAFARQRAFVDTPARLGRFLAPTLAAIAFVLAGWRGLASRRDAPLLCAAAGGFVSACVGFGTQWAFDNAFIPAVYFPSLAAAVLLARLAAHALMASDGAPRSLTTSALAVAAFVALGAQTALTGAPDFKRWVPTAADRTAAAVFLADLRALPGDVFIPFHPYYAVLAGKTPHLHRMGVWDVAAAYGRPKDLDRAMDEQQFSFIVLDWKSRPFEWPNLEARYQVVRVLADGRDSVRSFSGAETSPRFVLAPNR